MLKNTMLSGDISYTERMVCCAHYTLYDVWWWITKQYLVGIPPVI